MMNLLGPFLHRYASGYRDGTTVSIEVRVAELRQLFNAIDPSPFHERDLDPKAEAFIVGWARELPRDAPLALRVHLDRACGREDEASGRWTHVGDCASCFAADASVSPSRRCSWARRWRGAT
jgi:hypothetical protein